MPNFRRHYTVNYNLKRFLPVTSNEFLLETPPVSRYDVPRQRRGKRNQRHRVASNWVKPTSVKVRIENNGVNG
jgi:hypothetical protein